MQSPLALRRENVAFARGTAVAALVIACMPAGCISQPAEALAEALEEGVPQAQAAAAVADGAPAGLALDGHALDGHKRNGEWLTGRTVVGVSFRDGRLGASRFEALALDGAELVASAEGRKVAGRELAGAELRGVLDDGSKLTLRIDGIAQPRPEMSDVPVYEVSFPTDDAGWVPLCGVGADGRPVPAIALAGRWDGRQGAPGGGSKIDDPSMFTFACAGSALAVCVELGYQPWKEVETCSRGACSTVSLAGHHQACTRMIRADYCGDGTAHAAGGTFTVLHDALGVQGEGQAGSFDAEWAESGARCVKRGRAPAGSAPGCVQELFEDTCGAASHFRTGTLVMSEAAPSF